MVLMLADVGQDIIVTAHLVPLVSRDATHETREIKQTGFAQYSVLVKNSAARVNNSGGASAPARKWTSFLTP